MKKYVVRIENADVSLNGKRVLHGISWTLNPGENWAVMGPNGSGKSTFLKLLRGDIWPEPGRGKRSYAIEGEEQDSPIGMKGYISLVTSELQASYYRNGCDLSGEEVVQTGFLQSVWLQDKPDRSRTEAAENLMSQLGIRDLRGKGFLSMSHGEARKILIARALVSRPAVLVLDEGCDGLDQTSRQKVLDLLDRLAREGTQIIYATHRYEELVPSISHVLLLKRGRIQSLGRREDVFSSAEFPSRAMKTFPAMHSPERGPNGRGYLVKIKNASVYLGSGRVLADIDWGMKRGQNWAVFGKNGSGKSTLLKLISGDLHPALGGEVMRFGCREGGGIWGARKRMGCVSAELQTRHDEEMNGEDVVVSGLFSSVGLYREATERQRKRAKEVIGSLGIERLARKNILEISYGEMRKLLIARALANRPEVLILDEPCNGLDHVSREDFLCFLESVSLSGTGVIMATHHKEELMPLFSHVLLIDGGRIVAEGKREDLLTPGFFDL